MSFAQLTGVWVDGPLDELVPVNTSKQLDIPRGSSVTIDFYLVDQDGEPKLLDLLGLDRLFLSVRQTFSSGMIFQVLAVAHPDNTPGKYLITIASATTLDLSGRMAYDVWATYAGSTRQVVAPSYFNLTPRMPDP